ncbi:type IV pilus assembly protein PilM, partial [Elusimicrobiota bacterium]
NVAELAIEDKSPEERKLIYIDVLKSLISQNKFTTKNVAVSISGSSVIVRFVKFPKMTPAELKKTLPFEAEPHIPFNIDEVDMDTQIIRDIDEEEQVKMETVLVASKKEIIMEKVDIITMSGLKPTVIDVDAFALGNAYEWINKDEYNSIMIVNIGASTTNICIVENGVAKVVRDLYVAGNNLTKAMQTKYGMPLDQADECKFHYGLSGGMEGLDPGKFKSDRVELQDSPELSSQTYEALYPIVKEINSELQRSIDYFTSQQDSTAESIEKIIITGGSASLIGLPEMVNSDLKIPVEVFRPLKNVERTNYKGKLDPEIFSSPSLAVITGLALRTKGDNK